MMPPPLFRFEPGYDWLVAARRNQARAGGHVCVRGLPRASQRVPVAVAHDAERGAFSHHDVPARAVGRAARSRQVATSVFRGVFGAVGRVPAARALHAGWETGRVSPLDGPKERDAAQRAL